MFVRATAVLMLLGAVFTAGVEVLQWFLSGRYDALTARELWLALGQTGFLRAEIKAVAEVARWIWDPVMLSTLRLPAWSILGAPALLLMWYAARQPHSRFFKRRHFSGGSRGRGKIA